MMLQSALCAVGSFCQRGDVYYAGSLTNAAMGCRVNLAEVKGLEWQLTKNLHQQSAVWVCASLQVKELLRRNQKRFAGSGCTACCPGGTGVLI
jgi:hypothetical protein